MGAVYSGAILSVNRSPHHYLGVHLADDITCYADAGMVHLNDAII